MLLSGTVRIEEESFIIEIPAIHGVTFCRLNENPLSYAEDFINSFGEEGLAAEARWIEKGTTFIVQVKNTAVLTGVILKELRTQAGLSLNATAQKLGLKSHNSVAAYESGTRDPSLYTLSQMLEAFGCDFEIVIRDLKR